MRIESTKEYKVMQELEKALNDYNWSPQRFADSVVFLHKTLQQTLVRTIVKVIEKIGAEDYRVDPRNKASHELCRNIVNSGLLKNISLPIV